MSYAVKLRGNKYLVGDMVGIKPIVTIVDKTSLEKHWGAIQFVRQIWTQFQHPVLKAMGRYYFSHVK